MLHSIHNILRMQNNIVFRLIIGILISFNVSAQCPSLSPQSPGAFPSILPNASVGLNYFGNSTLVFARDTVYSGFTLNIDSIIISSISNIPAGIDYYCGSGDCIIYPSQITFSLPRECLSYSGTAVNINQNDTMVVHLEKWISLFGTSIKLDDTIHLVLKTLDDLSLNSNSPLIEPKLFPNPTNAKFDILVENSASVTEVTVLDRKGKVLQRIAGDLIEGGIVLDQESGLFFVDILYIDGKRYQTKIVKY